MDREEYKMMVDLQNKIPPQQETPEGQKFHIGEIVKCNTPRWFVGDKKGLYEIQYSYKQKFGGEDIKSYSLKHLFENNQSSWYDESELELVKSISEINEEKDFSEYSRLRAKYEKN
jgi:hypothetical protein